MLLSSVLLVTGIGAAHAFNLSSSLPGYLKQAAATTYPALKNIAVQIYNLPEVGLNEHHAHDWIVNQFAHTTGWEVTPHAYGLPTAFEARFEHRPYGFRGELPVVGIMAEYDALSGIGHACAHHLIALSAMTTARLISDALVHYNIAGRVLLLGCPDEETAAGKFKLNNAGAFDGSDVWMLAHPASKSAFQAMNARLNYFAKFLADTHPAAVAKAYEALAIVADVNTKLPGTASTAVGIENVGLWTVNTVQTSIGLGVSGSDIQTVNKTVASILDQTYPNVTYTIAADKDGVAIRIKGEGGHASESTKGALTLSIETFKALKSTAGVGFYLPGNVSTTELDITVDMRTRYTADIPAVASAVTKALGSLPNSVSQDVQYPALELDPYFPATMLPLLKSPDYNLTDFVVSPIAPASSDASWPQGAVVDPTTHQLLSVDKVILHLNFNICDRGSREICPFNHDPYFYNVSGTPFAFQQTEIVARVEAQAAIELLADPSKMAQATALIKK